MNENKKEMIATLVKEGRLAKGYTQKELSELSNISIRSIQRIENGEIIPRSYTLKTIAEIIDKPFEDFINLQNKDKQLEDDDINNPAKEETSKQIFTINKTQRIILSAGCCLIILFLSWAYIEQSHSFPETTFEMLIFSAAVLFIITIILLLLWKNKK